MVTHPTEGKCSPVVILELLILFEQEGHIFILYQIQDWPLPVPSCKFPGRLPGAICFLLGPLSIRPTAFEGNSVTGMRPPTASWQSWNLNPGLQPHNPCSFHFEEPCDMPSEEIGSIFCICTDCLSFDGKVTRLPGASISLLMIRVVFLIVLAQPGSEPPACAESLMQPALTSW